MPSALGTSKHVLVATALAFAFAWLDASAQPPSTAKAESAGPYVPTPWVIVDEIMKLAAPGAGDFVIDLGSGDGRLVIRAVAAGARGGYGVDIDPSLVRLANENAVKAGIADRVRFETRDLFATSVADASIVTLYLLPSSVPKLETKLMTELRPGARVVSHDYPFPDWPAERVVKLDVPEKVNISGTPRTTLYLYIVPAPIAGQWDFTIDGRAPLSVSFAQKADGATGEARVHGRALPLSSVRVAGENVELTLPPGAIGQGSVTLRGKARGDTMEGTGSRGESWRAARRTS